MRLVLLLSLLLLPACVPTTSARGPSPAELPATTIPEDVPDLSGEWVVQPKDGGFTEIWTIQQAGNTLIGTIAYDPAGLPSGYANPTHDLYGALQPAGFGWIAQMQTPEGTLTVANPDQFTFCTRPTGSQTCRSGVKRLKTPAPSPSPR